MKRSFILDGFFIFLLIALTLAFIQTLRPFLVDIAMAVILVNACWAIFAFFRRRLNAPLSSFITVLLVFLVVAGLFALLVLVLSREAFEGLDSLRLQWPSIRDQLLVFHQRISGIPIISNLIGDLDPQSISTWFNQELQKASKLLLQIASKSVTSIGFAIVHFILILLLMFFLFIGGPKLLERIKYLIPLSESETNEFIERISLTSRAVLVSTVVIGLIEGIYAGVLFTIFGLPSPVLWGMMTVIVSMIPLVGANAIIVPAGIFMIIGGRYVHGVILILLGFGGVAMTQNFLKPKLMGGRIGLHPVIILLAVIGGIAWLGLIGFIVGPLIAALFILIWDQFGKRFMQGLSDGDVSQ
ncbi:MAG: AI-2E family transporter [Spirochaetes bacterium]|nr:AI-2E family transporter [Spirochaetota bacterium]